MYPNCDTEFGLKYVYTHKKYRTHAFSIALFQIKTTKQKAAPTASTVSPFNVQLWFTASTYLHKCIHL